MEDLSILKMKKKQLVEEYNDRCFKLCNDEYYDKVRNLNKQINALQFKEMAYLLDKEIDNTSAQDLKEMGWI